MSLSIEFSSPDHAGDAYQLASAGGWKLFGDWVDTLPPRFKTLKRLSDDGEILGTDKLSDELSRALEVYPPKRPVTIIAIALLDKIAGGSPVETASITL